MRFFRRYLPRRSLHIEQSHQQAQENIDEDDAMVDSFSQLVGRSTSELIGLHDVSDVPHSQSEGQFSFPQNLPYYQNRGPPPASDITIMNLRTTTVTNQYNQTDGESMHNNVCHVCCDNFARDDILKQMPCGHLFHKRCIEDWLSRRCTCPVCRYELPTNIPSYEPGRRHRMKYRDVIYECQCEDTTNKFWRDAKVSRTASELMYLPLGLIQAVNTQRASGVNMEPDFSGND